jgi:hypothetical protein
MPSGRRPGATKRALLAAGTASYDYPGFEALSEVPDALRSVVEVLSILGFAVVAQGPGYQLNPTRTSLRAAVRKAADAAPVVVLYYTGHGVDLERDTYYLVGKKSQPVSLSESALAARDLLTLLTRRDDYGSPMTDQPTVLVILDCCFSGTAGMAMLDEAQRGIGNPNTWVITSAGAVEYAQQGVFVNAFCHAIREPTTGISQEFLSLDAIVQSINDAHVGQMRQKARAFPPATRPDGIPPFFPNPRYQPGMRGLTVADQQYWLSRVAGGPEEQSAGFYLSGKTGRLRAAEHLARWILDSSGPKPMAVVTGSPGTGKSALLALPTLLTDRLRRRDPLRAATPGSIIQRIADLLPVETPVTAIHARGLNNDQIAGVIAQALGRIPSTAFGLLESLDLAPQHHDRVVIVDAVDEAISPTTLVGELLIPLSRQRSVRVVVGTRRSVLTGIEDIDTTIDLDTVGYRDPEALTDYINRLLIAAEEPGVITCYQPSSNVTISGLDAAGAVAKAIAQRATTRGEGAESFLIGRLLALSVRSRPEPTDVGSPGWHTELPDSVADAFDEELARLGNKQRLVRVLLEALAWSKGPGLPWETIWVPVATALAQRRGASCPSSITDDDVRYLLDKCGAYVVEDVGPGQRSVFRPFHELLAVHLRGESSAERNRSDAATESCREQGRLAEEAITNALLTTVPAYGQTSRDWASAHPYLRTYLAQHAAAAGTHTLTALLSNSDFLAVADPVTLSPLLSR